MQQTILTIEPVEGVTVNDGGDKQYRVVQKDEKSAPVNVLCTGTLEECRNYINRGNTQFTTTSRNVEVKYD